MARTPGEVTVTTFAAIVATDEHTNDFKGIDRKELVRLANLGEAYQRSLAGLRSEDAVSREALIKRGRDKIEADERAANPPQKPGRKVSAEVLAAIKRHFPQHYAAFEAGTLDTDTRKQILTSCRAFVQLGASGAVASAE